MKSRVDYDAKISENYDIVIPSKSRAAKVLNERILKKLIFLVLIMNGAMNLLGSEFYADDSSGFESDL